MPEDIFRPQFGEPHHLAYVVEDIEATVDRLVEQLGAGPFFHRARAARKRDLARRAGARSSATSKRPFTLATAASARDLIPRASEAAAQGAPAYPLA